MGRAKRTTNARIENSIIERLPMIVPRLTLMSAERIAKRGAPIMDTACMPIFAMMPRKRKKNAPRVRTVWMPAKNKRKTTTIDTIILMIPVIRPVIPFAKILKRMPRIPERDARMLFNISMKFKPSPIGIPSSPSPVILFFKRFISQVMSVWKNWKSNFWLTGSFSSSRLSVSKV